MQLMYCSRFVTRMMIRVKCLLRDQMWRENHLRLESLTAQRKCSKARGSIRTRSCHLYSALLLLINNAECPTRRIHPRPRLTDVHESTAATNPQRMECG